MQFIRTSDYRELQAQNEAMSNELATYRDLDPVIRLAQELRTELTNALTNRPELTPSEIGDLAYQKVMASHLDKARDEVVARYEQQHREELYQQVINDVEVSEGELIFDSVRTRIETDPDLAVELRESAKKELAARANDHVKQKISEEEQAVLDEETERQIKLDRLDVELAVEHELDLLRDDVTELIQNGDELVIYFTSNDNSQGNILFRWATDVKNKSGWVFVKSNSYFTNKRGDSVSLPTNKFLNIGTILHDLSTGEEVVTPNVLKVGDSLAIIPNDTPKSKKPVSLIQKVGSSYYTKTQPKIIKTDFRTKALSFN